MSIYQRFCIEEFTKEGRLLDIKLNYPDNFNFGYDVVDVIAKETPNKRALVWANTENEEHTFTFEDIRYYSNKIANVFKRDGIKKGDRVMLVLKRHYEYWFCAIALHKLGAVMIPATHMLTVNDYIYRIKASKIKAVVCTSQNEVPEHLNEAIDNLKIDVKKYCVFPNIPGYEYLMEKAMNESDSLDRVATLSTDPMMLYFTSGTTGYPKGVIHSHSYPLAHIVTAKYWQKAEDDGLHFTLSEIGWAKASWGKLYGQWLVGSAVMVYDFDNFEPKQLTHIINHYKVTTFCAPPTVYRYLAKKGIDDMPYLKHATTAGETLSKDVFIKFKEHTGLNLCEGYGQTETTLLIANLDDPVEGSMGLPSPFYKIELRDKSGNRVKSNEIGEVVIIPKDGKNQVGVFTSYLDNEEQYNYVWRDGIYHTGDAAYMDDEGRFWFHGRFDDLIKTGGFRVGPYEVENVLNTHPAVLESSVVGVPDTLRGQAIKAFVVLNEKYEQSKELEKELKDYTNSQLSEYKWIRIVEFVSDLPKTISGKIKKNILRSEESR